MEYPQTPAEVRIFLKGNWQKENTNITFSIAGSKMSNIKGVREGNDIPKLLYTIKRIGDHFHLSNDIFTFGAELESVDESEFILLEAPEPITFERKVSRFIRI